MNLIAAHGGVTFVHHHRHHAPPVGADGDIVEAPLVVVGPVPARRQGDHRRVVRVVLVIALGRPPTVPVLLEAVEGQRRLSPAGDGRRALVRGVQLALLAALGAVVGVAFARRWLLPLDLAARLAWFGFCAQQAARLSNDNKEEEEKR